MRPSNRLTPYPVLASYRDDYLEASFDASVEAVQQFGDLRVNVTFSLNEPTLKDLIDEGKAEYAIHVECPSTSYRKCIETREGYISESLDRLNVKDVVEVCTFVIASKHIDGFVSPRFHPDYEGWSFDIDEGGVLAIGECKRITVKSNDDLAKRSSIIRVTRAGSGQQDAMAINTDLSDNILVSLKPELHDIYVTLGNGPHADSILSLVIVPALQAVITRMIEQGGDGGDSEKEWFKSIVELLERNGIAFERLDNYSEGFSALAISQKLLSQPIERSLKSLAKEAD